MLSTTENQVIALAGVFQAIQNVKELAHTGRCNESAFDDSIRSILTMDAASVAEVFRDNQGIRIGLGVLKEQLLSTVGHRDTELSRYAITVIHLESRLRANTAILARLQQGITQLEAQARLNGISDALVDNMADLYSETISQLSPRIMVNGESHYLTNEHLAARIRASLLAAMRAAVLWRQCGGSRLHLLFKRSQYLEVTDHLIADLARHESVEHTDDA